MRIVMRNDFVKRGGRPQGQAGCCYGQDTHHRGDPEWETWPEHGREGSWRWEIVAELAPKAYLRKVRYDAFFGPSLDHLLRLSGIGTLIMCGTVANFGVQYTAARAALRWYHVVIPGDAGCALEPFDLEASLRQTRSCSEGR